MQNSMRRRVFTLKFLFIALIWLVAGVTVFFDSESPVTACILAITFTALLWNAM